MTNKPVPNPNADSRHYWDRCKEGQLSYQFCTSCETAQFPPGNRCRICAHAALEWRISAGQAVIHSITTVHRAPMAAFKEDVPYSLALIDLAEGFRIMCCIRGEGHLDARIGDTVHIVFEPLNEDVTLPQAQLGPAPALA